MKKRLRKLLKAVGLSAAVLLVLVGVLVAEHFGAWWYRPGTDSLTEVVDWSADHAGTTPDDTQLRDILKRVRVIVERAEPNVFVSSRDRVTLWDPDWPDERRFGEPPADDRRWIWSDRAEDVEDEVSRAVEVLRSIKDLGYDELVENAASAPEYLLSITARDGVPELDLEPMRSLRVIRDIERLRAHLAIEARDDDLLLQACERVLWVESVSRRVPGKLGDGFAIVATEYAIDATVEYAMHGKPTRQTLQRLDVGLASLTPDHLVRVLDQEYLLGRAMMEGVLHRSGIISGGSPKRQFATLERVTDELRATLSLPARERRRAYSLHIESLAHDGWEYFRNKSAYTVTPGIGVSIAMVPELEAEIAMARLLLAVECHRLRHGSLPARVSAIDADLLPDALADPYNPGSDIVYRVFDEPDRFGRAYVIYSSGYNGADDGGVYHAEPTARGRPWATDLMINPPPWIQELPAEVLMPDTEGR